MEAIMPAKMYDGGLRLFALSMGTLGVLLVLHTIASLL
jgi:hypothetical protein